MNIIKEALPMDFYPNILLMLVLKRKEKTLLKNIKKALGIICLIEVFFGIYLMFTEWKNEPIAGILVCSIFGFLAYLLLRKKTEKLQPEEHFVLETLPQTQGINEAKRSDINIETDNTIYPTENTSATKQLKTALSPLDNSLNELNKTLSSDNILKDTIPQNADMFPSPQQKTEDSYINDGNMIFKTDDKEISDKEVPYLIQIGREKIIEKQANFKTDLLPDLNEQERYFFNELKLALSTIKRDITAERMSNGVISVYSNSFYVGKIKLSGRKHWMQILRGQTQIKVIDGELDDFIQRIPDWVRYIRIHCK